MMRLMITLSGLVGTLELNIAIINVISVTCASLGLPKNLAFYPDGRGLAGRSFSCFGEQRADLGTFSECMLFSCNLFIWSRI